MSPFSSRDAAAYWGGGVLAEVPGGWYSLHARSHPNGVDLSHVGAGTDDQHPVSAEGWPADVRGRYVYATPDGGGQRCICEVA